MSDGIGDVYRHPIDHDDHDADISGKGWMTATAVALVIIVIAASTLAFAATDSFRAGASISCVIAGLNGLAFVFAMQGVRSAGKK